MSGQPQKRIPYSGLLLPGTQMIPLTQGLYSKVDEKNYEWLMEFNWFAMYDPGIKGYYVARNVRGEGYRWVTEYMHQLITDFRWEKVDHINWDTLDNLESNLRDGEHNARHGRPQGGTSKYHGVSWDREAQKWRACIRVNNVTVHLGRWPPGDEKKAAQAYDTASLKYHGENGTRNWHER